MLQRQNINHWINSRFKPVADLKIGIFVLIPNFTTQKGISKKLQPLRKGPYQIIDKPTDVTYKLFDTSKKKIVQHRNNLLPYYPKEYALREKTQLCFFTGLKIVQNNSENESNQHTNEQMNSKTDQQKELVHQTSPKQKTQTSQKERKNRKMTKKSYHRIKMRNLHIENHHDLEVSQEKTTKPSFHNLKY